MSITEIEAYRLSRRGFLNAAALSAASIALSACATSRQEPVAPPPPAYVEPPLPDYATMYAAVNDGGFDVPAIPYEQIDPQYLRQIVPDPTGQKPGTLVVDTTGHHLYLVRPGGQAIRYPAA
jgi:lipoprotein-anchoring transpeptidase ErfK/SrfK